jgi:RNA polymerase sigma-70 factor (ECF subfamily)
MMAAPTLEMGAHFNLSSGHHFGEGNTRCLADDGPTPSEVAAERETAVRLADTPARLPENYQRVLLLRLFEGLTAGGVAERMGSTAGAVRMLQMRAPEALRELMAKPA